MSLTLAKLKYFVTIHNHNPARGHNLSFFADLSEADIALSDLGPIFVVHEQYTDKTITHRSWQTPYGDLIEMPNGRLRINDEGENA